MKLIKRSIAFIITLALVITAFAGMTFAASENSNISAKVNGDTKDIEVYVGETFTVTLDTRKMSVSTFAGGIGFDKEIVEYKDYVGATGTKAIILKYYDEELQEESKVNIPEKGLSEDKEHFGFVNTGTKDISYYAASPLVTVTFTAIAAGSADIYLYEKSDGADGYSSDRFNPGFTVTVKENALKSIAIKQAPAKTAYHTGEKFDKTGMKVTATYDNGATKDATDKCIVSDKALTASDKNVTISYTENEVTKETTQAITVSGHSYKETWEWAKGEDGKYTGATLTLNCTVSGCKKEATPEVEFDADETAPKCEEDGQIVYTATAVYEGKTYTDTKTVVLPKHGHKYTGMPATFKWADDNKSATATFDCAYTCGHKETVNAVVQEEVITPPTCTEDGSSEYTATAKASAEDEEYKAKKTVTTTKLGHAYSSSEVRWEWADDLETADAYFTCTRKDCDHEEKVVAEVTHETTTIPTCHSEGVETYTATAKITSEGKEVTATASEEKTLPTTGHDLEVKSCVWAEDFSSAEITIGCKHCSFTTKPATSMELIKTVDPKCEVAGKYVYRATAIYEEKEYTSDGEEPIPALGHDYTGVDPEWNWAEDYSSATATFRCTRDGCEHSEVVNASISSEQTLDPTCTEKGVMTYTAKAKGGDGYGEYEDYAYADIEALGHDWDEGKVIKEATAKEKGIIEYHCKRTGCKETKQEEFAQKNDKIEVSTKIEVSEAMKEAGLTDEKKVKAKIEGTLVEKSGFDAKNVLTYEITLMVSFDNGKTYVPATSADIPEEGLLVTIPYPEGTSKKDSFVIAHMFAETTDEHKAGDVEILDIVKQTGNGIQVVVHSLSPFSVGYKLAEEPTQPVGPNTGDSNNALLWIILAILSAMVIGGGIFLERKYKIFTK